MAALMAARLCTITGAARSVWKASRSSGFCGASTKMRSELTPFPDT